MNNLKYVGACKLEKLYYISNEVNSAELITKTWAISMYCMYTYRYHSFLCKSCAENLVYYPPRVYIIMYMYTYKWWKSSRVIHLQILHFWKFISFLHFFLRSSQKTFAWNFHFIFLLIFLISFGWIFSLFLDLMMFWIVPLNVNTFFYYFRWFDERQKEWNFGWTIPYI